MGENNGFAGHDYPDSWDDVPEDPSVLRVGERLRGAPPLRPFGTPPKDVVNLMNGFNPKRFTDDLGGLIVCAGIVKSHKPPTDRDTLCRWIMWYADNHGVRPSAANDLKIAEAVDRMLASREDMKRKAFERGQKIAAERGGSVTTSKRFAFIDSDELVDGDFRPEWLIKNVMVKGQPGGIIGPTKALKTNTGVDAAVSVASGSPFLGQFAVPAKQPVAVVSGESGAQTLQETLVRVCKAKRISPKLGGMLRWCFDIPDLSDLAAVDEMVSDLADHGTKFVLLDPLYLMLGACDAKNMFETGPRLRVISERFVKAGATPFVVHHSTKQLAVGAPMELKDAAFAGLDQFVRQWLLLNRRSAYRDDGIHDLWVRIGGSAGHGGLWGVRVEEGLTDETFKGRRWDVQVMTTEAVRTSTAELKTAEKRKKLDDKAEAARGAALHAIDVELERYEAATLKAIRARSGLSHAMATCAIDELRENGVIEPHQFKKPTGNGAVQTFDGYRRFTPKPHAPESDLLTGLEEQPEPKRKATKKTGKGTVGQKSNGGKPTVPPSTVPPSEKRGNDGG
jgi:hypothetical protein